MGKEAKKSDTDVKQCSVVYSKKGLPSSEISINNLSENVKNKKSKPQGKRNKNYLKKLRKKPKKGDGKTKENKGAKNKKESANIEHPIEANESDTAGKQCSVVYSTKGLPSSEISIHDLPENVKNKESKPQGKRSKKYFKRKSKKSKVKKVKKAKGKTKENKKNKNQGKNDNESANIEHLIKEIEETENIMKSNVESLINDREKQLDKLLESSKELEEAADLFQVQAKRIKRKYRCKYFCCCSCCMPQN